MVSYKDSGVNIDAGNKTVELIKNDVKRTFRPEVMTDLGSFAGSFALNIAKYKEPVLMSGTDGVGTKLKIAIDYDKHDTIGIDAVAMCVNDILVTGAEPLFFLDYVAVGKLTPEKNAAIVHGVAEGCLQSGCALIGGETAEMPGMYDDNDYDIAGFAVGVVDKSKIIDGHDICAGDVVVGLPSTGVHSNGFSLVRKIVFDVVGADVHDFCPELGMTFGEALLTPTKLYVKDILPLCEKNLIKGMAHITGGGLLENVPRVLPEGVSVELDTTAWERQPIFKYLQAKGDVPDMEMYRVFNMGIGMAIITDAQRAEAILAELPDAKIIGKVIEGNQEVILKGLGE